MVEIETILTRKIKGYTQRGIYEVVISISDDYLEPRISICINKEKIIFCETEYKEIIGEVLKEIESTRELSTGLRGKLIREFELNTPDYIYKIIIETSDNYPEIKGIIERSWVHYFSRSYSIERINFDEQELEMIKKEIDKNLNYLKILSEILINKEIEISKNILHSAETVYK